MKNKIILSLILLIFVALAFKANATVGVTSFYYEGHPLTVEPGETKEIEFTLQNHGGDADATVKVEVASGNEIAEFNDDGVEYIVPLDSNGIPVPMKITIPKYAQPGDEWNVGASFVITYTPKDTGAVQFSSTYFKDFKVIVEQPTPTAQATKGVLPSSPLLSFIYLVIVLIVLIVLIKLISKRKK
jgi:hypothetical protein